MYITDYEKEINVSNLDSGVEFKNLKHPNGVRLYSDGCNPSQKDDTLIKL